MAVASVPQVAHVETLRGSECPPTAPSRLLVEVPHGADEAAHYEAYRAALRGPFPEQLEDFFHVNTDFGAWDLGLAAARAFLAGVPEAAVTLIRCLVPRTFIDCNRVLGGDPEAYGGGVNAGLPVYVTDPEDRALLIERHLAYTALVDEATAAVAALGGLVLTPHTYAPRTVGIDRVEHDIVTRLHEAWAPGVAETWPLRPEVDLITRDAEGLRRCPPGLVEPLLTDLTELGLAGEECGTYWLHPATRAAELAARHPETLFCLEVRRDLLVEGWTPFVPQRPSPDRVEPLAAVLGRRLAGAFEPRAVPSAR